jgi:predicted nucleotidyltransferase
VRRSSPFVGGETTTQVVQRLRALKRRLARHIRIDRMILFGSRARGDWLLTSDAELMIVSPDFQGRRFVVRSAEVLRHWGGGVDLEVFCYIPEGIAERGQEIGLVAQALKEGRRT